MTDTETPTSQPPLPGTSKPTAAPGVSPNNSEKDKKKRTLIGLAIFGALVVSAPAAWNWWKLQSTPSTDGKLQFDASLEVVKTVATIAGGVVLFLNFRVANRNAAIANRNVELAQKKLEQETEKAKADAKLAESRLMMERFSKAVDMMGNDKSIHLRLGGIYALESIARDSSDDKIDDNYGQVLEVLTAFVRENSPWPPQKKLQEGEPKFKEEAIPPPHTGQPPVEGTGQSEEIPPLPTDIQAALTVLKRRKHKDKDWDLQRLDLSKTDLRRASLSEANLQEASLSEANLQEAILSGANLQKASLSEANLQQASLSEANLQQASLSEANLQQAFLFGANLQQAFLSGTNLQHANLFGANLQHAILLFTDLRNTENLDQECLGGDQPPLLCNVALPEGFKDRDTLKDQDCDKVAAELFVRYPQSFDSLEAAEQYVDELREKKWE